MSLQELTKNKKGSAIVLALSVMVVISFTAISAAQYLNSQIKRSQAIAYSAPAYYAAESGIECMLYEVIKAGNNPNTAETNCELDSRVGDGSYEIFQNQQGQIITITSTGSFKNTSRSLEIQLRKP